MTLNLDRLLVSVRITAPARTFMNNGTGREIPARWRERERERERKKQGGGVNQK